MHNYDSDIALLKLSEPSKLTSRVQLACLPERFDLSEVNLQEGKTGWVRHGVYSSTFPLCGTFVATVLREIHDRWSVGATMARTSSRLF